MDLRPAAFKALLPLLTGIALACWQAGEGPASARSGQRLAAQTAAVGAAPGQPAAEPAMVAGEVRYAGGAVHVRVRPQLYSFSSGELIRWVEQSARAVSLYFGRFPVGSASLTIEPASGLIMAKGTATSGPEPRIELALGRATTSRELASLSVLVHEMTHLAMPALEERHIWMHEGIATYVEHVGRAQAGLVTPREMWATFLAEMPGGLPAPQEGGLDGSNRQERRYWGGALFCLVADIEIRRATGNRLGLQDGLREVQREGGNLAQVWSISRMLAAADRGTGTSVLSSQYRSWGSRPVAPDIAQLWRALGIVAAASGSRGRVTLDEHAPLADIRRAITGAPSAPLLVARPRLLREAAMR